MVDFEIVETPVHELDRKVKFVKAHVTKIDTTQQVPEAYHCSHLDHVTTMGHLLGIIGAGHDAGAH